MGATATDVSEMNHEDQEKNQLLAELDSKPGLMLFIKNAVARLSAKALGKVIEYAKTFSGDIDFNDIERVQRLVQGQGKYPDRANRAPLQFHKISVSDEFTKDELHVMRFLFLCIFHFYNKHETAFLELAEK